jgi:Ring finger domain
VSIGLCRQLHMAAICAYVVRKMLTMIVSVRSFDREQGLSAHDVEEDHSEHGAESSLVELQATVNRVQNAQYPGIIDERASPSRTFAGRDLSAGSLSERVDIDTPGDPLLSTANSSLPPTETRSHSEDAVVRRHAVNREPAPSRHDAILQSRPLSRRLSPSVAQNQERSSLDLASVSRGAQGMSLRSPTQPQAGFDLSERRTRRGPRGNRGIFPAREAGLAQSPVRSVSGGDLRSVPSPSERNNLSNASQPRNSMQRTPFRPSVVDSLHPLPDEDRGYDTARSDNVDDAQIWRLHNVDAEHAERVEPHGVAIPSTSSAARRSAFIDQMHSIPNNSAATLVRWRGGRNFRGVYNFRPVVGLDFGSEVEEIDDEDYESPDDEDGDRSNTFLDHVPTAYRRTAQRLAFLSRDFTDADYDMLLELDERDWRPHASRRGASQDAIQRLETYQYSQRSCLREGLPRCTLDRCYICLEDFMPGTCVTALPCGHEFCQCVKRWLSSNASCPICRARISSSPPPDVSRTNWSPDFTHIETFPSLSRTPSAAFVSSAAPVPHSNTAYGVPPLPIPQPLLETPFPS